MSDLFDVRSWSVGLIPLLLFMFALWHIINYVRTALPFDGSPRSHVIFWSYAASLSAVCAMIAVLLEIQTVSFFELSFVGDDTRLVGMLTLTYGLVAAFLFENFIGHVMGRSGLTFLAFVTLSRPKTDNAAAKAFLFIFGLVIVAYLIFWIFEGQRPNLNRNMRSIFPLLFGQFETGFLYLICCFFSGLVYLAARVLQVRISEENVRKSP